MYDYLSHPHQVNNVVKRHIHVVNKQFIMMNGLKVAAAEDDEFSKAKDFFFDIFQQMLKLS